MTMSDFLKNRHEFLFLYDVRMANPNGDPDENRPRVLPDGTYYITDVRLKRFIRDYLKFKGNDILVDDIEGKTTNLTGRVGAYLDKLGKSQTKGRELVDIILDSFIDARLFGSTLAFKEYKGWKPEPEPKTITGAVQIKHGEALHRCHEVWIRGTTTFASKEDKEQGTFTEVYGLRYGLFGFNGIANEHNAEKSRMSEDDYSKMLKAMWFGVRSAANTRSKAGQSPRLLLDIQYRADSEYQFGCLLDYVKVIASESEKVDPMTWSGPAEYFLDLGILNERLKKAQKHIEKVSYCLNPDIKLAQGSEEVFSKATDLNFDELTK